jgi:ankyrin repeat protein
MLCERGIDVNAKNKNGDTCLNICVKNGPKENTRIIQKLLFDFKVDPNITNNQNDNFFSLMKKHAEKENLNLDEVLIYYNNNY